MTEYVQKEGTKYVLMEGPWQTLPISFANLLFPNICTAPWIDTPVRKIRDTLPREVWSCCSTFWLHASPGTVEKEETRTLGKKKERGILEFLALQFVLHSFSWVDFIFNLLWATAWSRLHGRFLSLNSCCCLSTHFG